MILFAAFYFIYFCIFGVFLGRARSLEKGAGQAGGYKHVHDYEFRNTMYFGFGLLKESETALACAVDMIACLCRIGESSSYQVSHAAAPYKP